MSTVPAARATIGGCSGLGRAAVVDRGGLGDVVGEQLVKQQPGIERWR